MRQLLIVVALLTIGGAGVVTAQQLSVAPGNEHFQRTWERTDRPVQDGVLSRTWMWAPEAFTAVRTEPYIESPGGMRDVQYFDKSRMEITDPDGDTDADWFVTNGLLVTELVTGQMQVGDADFIQRAPSTANVAGDSDDVDGPTYLTVAALRDGFTYATGHVYIDKINRAGELTRDESLASYNVSAAVLVLETDHTVASVFWEFMISVGTVYQDGLITTDKLFPHPYFATGLPLMEPYWADIKVGGQTRLVLIQCFERRCLTYTPDNPEGWQVEAGNVGQHYYQWRYETDEGTPPPVATAAPTATQGDSPSTSTPDSTTTATATATNSPLPTATATSPPAPTATATQQSNCHPSYPDHCIAPPPPDLNCADLPSSWKPIRVLHNVPNPDPHDFDRDSDGWGCVSG